MKTLYICYFGLQEPLVQTQVLPYLRELAAEKIEVYLLTFEPKMAERWTAETLADERVRLQREGINWSALPYHKSPSVPATVYDIAAGARMAVRLVRRYGIEVLHARAHIPLAIALIARRFVPCALIFDIRGLMAEEYADAGVWNDKSLKFRLVKKLEAAGIRKANQVVVLTERMKAWLVERRLRNADDVAVIPCCVSLAAYDSLGSSVERGPESFEVIYAGSASGLYLVEEMGRFFLAVRAIESRAYFRILTMSPEPEVRELLLRAGLQAKDFGIGRVAPDEVPQYLKRARIGLSFRKPTFSQIAASPTKIAEYLAAGVPVVSNRGIGDVDDLLQSERVGVVLNDFTEEALAGAANAALTLALDAATSARCREAARIHFDLPSVGGRRYVAVYEKIGWSRDKHARSTNRLDP